MFIYLNKSRNDFFSSLSKLTKDEYLLGSNLVYNVNSSPYINTRDSDPTVLTDNELLGKLFLKASWFSNCRFTQHREFGIYSFGEAKAELCPGKDVSTDELIISCESFNDLDDMVVLKQKIFAGTILPEISYENKQLSRDNFLKRFASKLKMLQEKVIVR